MLNISLGKTLYMVLASKGLRFTVEQIVWQEVPGEVSLAYTVSGCPLRCPGCHSSDSWDAACGTPLTTDYLNDRIEKYRRMITCVAFFGGEWNSAALLPLLRLVNGVGLYTCLYSGLDHVAPCIQQELTFLKTGAWIQNLGGLDSPRTNQRFIDLRSHQLLNHRFIKP